ncbi:hypothetical protein CAFE_38600 [Caprobacter fermentans]|uniref:Uncharacterized protein n=1 Tax=Caproicibacter fermentans TaxID=2576756 RepID=A0A6N8I561_9FIRM|nr:hypothetical protein [Caproicibacter fermentans]MVB13105.1 hypothetical protein [Caproicibacter fermentans]OCN01045.1 hypothetical protein A7X67_01675 [Clostridium sp. W14A]QNK40043.1 hypothetical protein HCR03_15240 [Caproicibacter fermentans]
MDYCKWGMEYLRQAQKLKEHLKPLRRRLKNTSGEDYVLLCRRVSMLNEMYLELWRTGRDLLERGDGE